MNLNGDESSSNDHTARLLAAAAEDVVVENRTSILFQKDIVLLALCWALTLTTSTLLTTVGPLSAKDLGATDDVSPFTIGTFLLGAAVSSYPSGKMFRKFGRYKGFSLGCVAQVIGSLSGLLAILSRNLALLYIGCFFIGLGQGLGQFYRFSAVEVALEQYKSEAVSLVLTGGVISAFLGPGLGVVGVDLFAQKYGGSFMMMGLIGVLNQYTVSYVNFPDEFMESTIEKNKLKTISLDSDIKDITEGETYFIKITNNDTGNATIIRPSELSVSSVAQTQKDEEENLSNTEGPSRAIAEDHRRRPMREIITQRKFVVSCLIATLAHTVMIMIMSNCTLAMDEDYSVLMQTFVMQSHFAGMFLPGFITGIYIKKFGTFTMSMIGGVLFAFSAVSFLQDDNAENYFIGMILLGVAWNFSFSAGTVMLTYTYRPMEAPDVQAVNDLILFSVASIGSLISGFIYAAYGWQTLIFCVSGMMGLNLMLLIANAVYYNEVSDEEKDDPVGETLGSLMKQSDDFSSYADTSISRYSILSRDSDDEYSIDAQRESLQNSMWNEQVRRVSFA